MNTSHIFWYVYRGNKLRLLVDSDFLDDGELQILRGNEWQTVIPVDCIEGRAFDTAFEPNESVSDSDLIEWFGLTYLEDEIFPEESLETLFGV